MRDPPGAEGEDDLRHDQADEHVGRVPDPEDGPCADQKVPDGAAADPGERGEKGEPERVHALARRHQRAGQGEDGNADGFEGDVVKEGHFWPAWAGGTAISPPPCGEG